MQKLFSPSKFKNGLFSSKRAVNQIMKTGVLALSLGGILYLGACGGSGGSASSTAVTEEEVVSSQAIDTFAAADADVKEVTPQVGFDAANSQLDDWGDWRGGSEYSLFDKLLSDSAEGIFAPVEFLSDMMMIIDMADDSGSDVWDEAGTFTFSGTDPETGESGEIAITISLVESAPSLPTFFQDEVPSEIQTSLLNAMNRIISFTIPGDESDTGWVSEVAIGEDDNYYYMIATSANETLVETQTFVGYMDRATETLTLYYASVGSDAGGGVYCKWSGNKTEDWFSLAQVTGGHVGNQEVVGGGTMAGIGNMAFKSRNNDDDSGDSTDVYYLADLTTANIEDAIDPGVAPIFAEPETGTGAIEYIIEGNEKCLGWIGQGQSPSARSELAWSPSE